MTTTAAAQGADPLGIFLTLLVLAALAALYFLPAIIAFWRHLDTVIQVALINFFLGWSLIGWIIALVWAAKPKPAPQPQQPPPWPQVRGR